MAATWLDAAGPLNYLSAQFIYFCQPLFSPLTPKEHLASLAQTLENPQQTHELAGFFRQYPRGERG